ncbi:MAG: ABC transporter permease [Candidatus Omnitrophica bacterium]|nr:ABC transporter permease [Candidatus Omnitrophota bacterium]
MASVAVISNRGPSSEGTVIRTPRVSLRWTAELLWAFTIHRISIRYKETMLGFGWILLHPVGLTVIFNYIRRIAQIPVGDVPYPLFTATGLVAWSLTSLVVNQSVGCITSYHLLLKRVALPKIIFPISVILTSIADLLVMMVLLVGLFFYYSYAVSWKSVWVLLPFVTHLGFLIGLSCLISLAVVFLRDIGYAANSILQLWFLASPVFYPSSMVPEEFKWLATWNPMTGLIEGYRSTLLLGQIPDPQSFIPAATIASAMLGLGLFLYRRLEGILADML